MERVMMAAACSGSRGNEEGLEDFRHLSRGFPRSEMADALQGEDLNVVPNLANPLQLDWQQRLVIQSPNDPYRNLDIWEGAQHPVGDVDGDPGRRHHHLRRPV